jgi:hypothetical protein
VHRFGRCADLERLIANARRGSTYEPPEPPARRIRRSRAATASDDDTHMPDFGDFL